MGETEQKKVDEFCSITGVDTDRAKFFLQAAGWDVGLAISTFFENQGDVDPSQSFPQSTASAVPAANVSASTGIIPKPESSTNPRGAPKSNSRIQTFASFSASARGATDSDDDDQGQAYYAGGSDTSGQQILGPPRKDANKKKNVAEELFKAAREHGAEEVSPSDRVAHFQQSHFAGTGYRLGESQSESSHAVPGLAKRKPPVTVVLKMWRQGFTLNDGSMRLFDDPENRQFLNSIHRGEIPQELVTMADGGKVAVDMEDHSSEEYQPPKQPKVQAFAGSGQTLGSDSLPQAASSDVVPTTAAVQVTIDDTLPVTNIQIRLADGSRLVAKFNHTHTIGDVRSHIAASRPEYVGVSFFLLTTLPNRRLTDDSLSLKDADLLNATIMQKL
ncbi:NSFL1 cofactor p47-like [Watersipora subatra]|uniref:NSFL1 cofactor p47-like n=1 Tax=Watersipora subatra TaxID=2589382 RepID=UPI00355C903E